MSVWMLDDTPNEYKSSVVTVMSYDKKRLAGKFDNPYYGQSLYFDNMVQLLIILENLQKATGYPRPSTDIRVFGEDDIDTGYISEIKKNAPVNATIAQQSFLIHVVFRQNSSWQGSLSWIEQRKEVQFRSALELIRLIDSAMRSADESRK